MPKLKVTTLSNSNNGRILVRLNFKHRNKFKRYSLAKIIKNNGSKESIIVMLLGFKEEDAISMPIDIREALKVDIDDELDFKLENACLLERLCWYFFSPDPSVRIPAQLAAFSILLGIISVGFNLCSLCSR
ncbi:MAG: hypothetical protein JKY84_10680 [Emcibacteraceae bacterium]|nr:hypothetical protein [Emcibacteraceae bacterium]